MRPTQYIPSTLNDIQTATIDRFIQQCYIPSFAISIISWTCLSKDLGIPLELFGPFALDIQRKYEPLGWKVIIEKSVVNSLKHTISFKKNDLIKL